MMLEMIMALVVALGFLVEDMESGDKSLQRSLKWLQCGMNARLWMHVQSYVAWMQGYGIHKNSMNTQNSPYTTVYEKGASSQIKNEIQWLNFTTEPPTTNANDPMWQNWWTTIAPPVWTWFCDPQMFPRSKPVTLESYRILDFKNE